MAGAPGYLKFPDHSIVENRLGVRVRVFVSGEVLADSMEVLRLDESGYLPRYYFPALHDKSAWLRPSDTMSYCPFKGTATYFTVDTGRIVLEDAAWTYAHPYDEHTALQERLAFYTEAFPELALRIDSE